MDMTGLIYKLLGKKTLKEVVSLRERKRIEEGLTYVTDGRTSFTTNGKKQELVYRLDGDSHVENDILIVHKTYTYYYWDDFFQYWTRAFAHSEHSETSIKK